MCQTCKLVWSDMSSMQERGNPRVTHASTSSKWIGSSLQPLHMGANPFGDTLSKHACRPRNQAIRPRSCMHVPMEASIWMATPCTTFKRGRHSNWRLHRDMHARPRSDCLVSRSECMLWQGVSTWIDTHVQGMSGGANSFGVCVCMYDTWLSSLLHAEHVTS